ncbi:MAG: hypothetical protein MK185_10520 [Saccharospirillaceae bacterium]|nr:hypothetical protein [Saccharospirillaceae bacterium]
MKNFILLASMLLPSLSLAGSDDFTVKGLGISTSNTIFLDVNESHSQSECSNKNSFRFKTAHPLYKEIYATLLTAKATRSEVRIAFSDSVSDCVYNSPQILSVYIK